MYPAGEAEPATDMDQGIPGAQPQGDLPAPVEPGRGPSVSAPSTSAGSSEQPLPAVVALAREAREAQRRGDLDRAAADLERALRLDADNATLWHQLAQVRLEQLRNDQAETLALKSNQFAGDDLLLQRANWNLIAKARRLRGDEAGAEQARVRARELIPE